MNLGLRGLFSMAVSLLFLGTGFAAGAFWAERRGEAPWAEAAAPSSAAVAPRPELAEEERATIDLFEQAAPSVVFVTTVLVRQDAFRMNVMEVPRGQGSGFLWDDAGHVVTNYHVIAAGDVARVTLADGSTWDAELVGAAPEKDLAVLQIDAPKARLRPLPIGTSADLQVGQKVLAIGNPFGLDNTLTTGIVSALGREIESLVGVPIRDLIQTDAAINPGNSGGPLLDSAGRLIGVNTAIYSPSGTYAGIGFAIPVDDVRWAADQLVAHGRILRPTLGVELAPVSVTRRLGLEGAAVVRVEPGSGAERSGIRGFTQDRRGRIQLGDVIVAVDGEPVKGSGDLLLALERRQPGDTVELELLRGGRRRALKVELDAARERR